MFQQLVLLHPVIAYIFLGLFTLSVGSLLNVIIYRLPLMMEAEWRTQCRTLLNLNDEAPLKINLFLPRSFCPQCKNTIPFWCNIPLLSYLLLRGRCHACKHAIPWFYPFIEALCLGLSLYAAWFFGFSLTLVFILPFIWILICLAAIDYHHQLLPDSLTLGLLWLGLIANTQALFCPLSVAIYGAAGAYLALWIFIKLFYCITGKIGMGNGDFKLFAAFGAWFGWMGLPLILLLASLIGAIVGILYLKISKKNKNTPIAFGPYLCLSGIVYLFFGPQFMHWYLGLF